MVLSDIRKQAREALSGKWGKTALIILVQLIITFIMNFCINIFAEDSIFRLIVSLMVTIIEVPISVGLIFAFVKLKREGDVGVFEFLQFAIKDFGRAWKLYLRILLKMILPILGVIATIIVLCVTIVAEAAGNHSLGISTLIIGIIILIVSMIFAIIIDLLYSLSYIIAYDNPEMTTKEAVAESANIMRGHRVELFLLQLSFIGWAILCVLTLGIGFLWLLPYKQMAIISFHDEINGKKQEGWETY